MSEVDFISADEPHSLQWVQVGIPAYVQVPATPPGSGSTTLAALTDVAGVADALTGEVLAKASDGKWRPLLLSTATGTHISFNQPTASTQWVIDYSSLPFSPAGVRVVLSDGSVTQAGIDDDPVNKTLTLYFSQPRSGRAEIGA